LTARAHAIAMAPEDADGVDRPAANWVAEAHALRADGRPIVMVLPDGRARAPPDPMSPVVIALQGMVQDRLPERGRPVSAVYGERVLALVPGRGVHVGAVLRGRPDRELRASMLAAARAVGARAQLALEAWTGDVASVEAVAECLRPVVARTASWGPGDVGDPLRTKGVLATTAVDFEGGRARFKVAAFNAGLAPVPEPFVELSLGRELLRLDAALPARALDGPSRLRMLALSPGDAGSVAALLEPLRPGSSFVEGELIFLDADKSPRHVGLPHRYVEVAPPPSGAIGTPRAGPPIDPGSADMAVRAWRYPASLGALDVLRTARTVLGTRGLELGAGSEATGPPPSWTVEAGSAHGRVPLGVGLTVTGGDVRELRLVVASTEAALVAWTVADVRVQLMEAFFRRWRGQAELEEVGAPRMEMQRSP
jgi:hypothetical protein